MRLRPNKRASIDQAPGPIIANVAPNTATMMEDQISAAFAHSNHPPAIATNVPATGVHRPTKRHVPTTAPNICGTTAAHSVAVAETQMTA